MNYYSYTPYYSFICPYQTPNPEYRNSYPLNMYCTYPPYYGYNFHTMTPYPINETLSPQMVTEGYKGLTDYNVPMGNSHTEAFTDVCQPGAKGELIDSGGKDLEIVSLKYEIYECEIRVVSSAGGLLTRTDVINRENNTISYEWGRIPVKQKVSLELRDKTLYGTIEYFHFIPLVGWRLTRRFPAKLGSWNNLKL